jgi:hypothetical protein
MRFLQSFLIVLLLGAAAAGRDIYVDNSSGDDQFAGRNPVGKSDMSGPVRTIAKALRLAGNGDTIVLAKTGVPYRESISLVGSRNSGTSERPFSIRGNGAIIDGSAPVPPKAWEHFQGATFRYRPLRAGYQQLFLNDLPAERVFASEKAANPPELKPLQWCWFQSRIYFCVEKTKLPGDYRLSCLHQQIGVTLFHVDHVRISNLTLQGFQLDGINLYNSAKNVTLSDVTCRGNGRSGICVGGASLAAIDASLLGNNGLAQLLTLPYSETHVNGSHLLSNTAPGWVDQGGRVYLDKKRIEGGLDEFRPPVSPKEKP